MNLEEVRSNIGNKVKRKVNGLVISGDMIIHSFKEDNGKVFVNISYHEKSTCHMVVDAKDIELSDKTMKNYKIRVTPETSGEVQKLFFDLGCSWSININQPKYLNDRFLYTENGLIKATNDYGMFIDNPAKGITIPELREMVVLKRNDVGDSTHVGRSGSEFYRGLKDYFFNGIEWVESQLDYSSKIFLEPKPPQVKIESPPWEFADMTWKDAERSIKEGKNVQVFVCEWTDIGDVFKNHKFRLKPQTTQIEGGDYTKEELLKIAGEM